MQEYSVLGGKCPGESKKKLGGFCPWWKMSRRIEKKIGRKLSWEENIQEDRKKNQEEIVLGGKCPGESEKKSGGFCSRGKMSWEDRKKIWEDYRGGKCSGRKMSGRIL